MDKDKLTKVLNRLYIEGKISKEDREKMMKEIPNKRNDFEEQVNKAVQEVMDDGYVKKTIERIFKQKRK